MWHRPVEDWFRFVQIIFFSLFFRFAVDGTKRSSYWGPEFFFSFTWGVVFFHALPASFFLTSGYFFFLRTSTPSDHGVLSEARLMHFRRQSHARCVCLFMPLYFFSQVYQLTTTVCFVGPDWTVRFFPLLLCFFRMKYRLRLLCFLFQRQSFCSTSLTFHDILLSAPDWRSHLAILTWTGSAKWNLFCAGFLMFLLCIFSFAWPVFLLFRPNYVHKQIIVFTFSFLALLASWLAGWPIKCSFWFLFKSSSVPHGQGGRHIKFPIICLLDYHSVFFASLLFPHFVSVCYRPCVCFWCALVFHACCVSFSWEKWKALSRIFWCEMRHHWLRQGRKKNFLKNAFCNVCSSEKYTFFFHFRGGFVHVPRFYHGWYVRQETLVETHEQNTLAEWSSAFFKVGTASPKSWK